LKVDGKFHWKIPPTLHQFLKEFLSLWGFGEVWGIFPGYVGKIIETWVSKLVVTESGTKPSKEFNTPPKFNIDLEKW